MQVFKLFKRLYYSRAYLRSLPQTIYFNFHYLPLCQAVKLPILLYKPHLKKLKGTVKIFGKAKFGVVRLGFPQVSLYQNSGITIENQGGTILFRGRCGIGNNSFLSIGPKGCVEFGDRFNASTTLRLVSYDKITFHERVRLGWDILIMDTDFHKLTKLDGGYSHGHAPIEIGADNWIGSGCRIMKRTKTPDHCVVAAGTFLSSPISVAEYSVVGNVNKPVVKATGMWRNIDDDRIEY